MVKLPMFLRGRGKMWSKLGISHWSRQVKIVWAKSQKHDQRDMTNLNDHVCAGKSQQLSEFHEISWHLPVGGFDPALVLFTDAMIIPNGSSTGLRGF